MCPFSTPAGTDGAKPARCATPAHPNLRWKLGLVWLRRDLRLDDHAALAAALRQCEQVQPVFVFDRDILDPLPRADARLTFIHASLTALDAELRRRSGDDRTGLIAVHGWPREVIPALAQSLGAGVVFAARDFEPAAQARDADVAAALAARGVAFETALDHVVLEPDAVRTQGGTPYTVFTPYSRAWLARLQDADLAERDTSALPQRLAQRPPRWSAPLPTLAALGFDPVDLGPVKPGAAGAQQLLADFLGRIDVYDRARDFPALKGPSYLSVHLRFGTVSVRELLRHAHPRALAGSSGAATWRNELIWREFYVAVLRHFPHVVTQAFKPAYDAIVWDTDEAAQARFAAWCAGATGYPIVDAAMRQLNQSGYMHNRLRMVAGSFLVKDLGLDWRWGERYFALKLLDFDLAANNGGWQWVASSGCDAQPYFRIFNPISQSQKFDPQGRFIRRYVPELAGLPDAALHAPWLARPMDLQAAGVRLGIDYPTPIVDHAQARARTLARYAVVKAA